MKYPLKLEGGIRLHDGDGHGIGGFGWPSDAAEVLQKVNAYDGLVAALKEIADSPRGYTGNPYHEERCTECEDMQMVAKEALKALAAGPITIEE